jgi:shikimate kinase
MKQTGQPTVLLDATISELLARCRNSTIERPLAKDEARFRQLYAERQST